MTGEPETLRPSERTGTGVSDLGNGIGGIHLFYEDVAVGKSFIKVCSA